MRLRRGTIIALICLNVALLAMILIGPGAKPGQAQVVGASGRYVVVSGEYEPNKDAIYLVDAARGAIVGFQLVPTAEGGTALQEVPGRDLLRDFDRPRD
jgi:hypothetical protein